MPRKCFSRKQRPRRTTILAKDASGQADVFSGHAGVDGLQTENFPAAAEDRPDLSASSLRVCLADLTGRVASIVQGSGWKQHAWQQGRVVLLPEAANSADAVDGSVAAILHDALRHGRHVSTLALELFDGLKALHGLSDIWRSRLGMAALLHDIGQIYGERAHHKNSQALILGEKAACDDLGTVAKAVRVLLEVVPSQERTCVAQLARYHRKAWPSMTHELFAGLSLMDRQALLITASILRIADGLDVQHEGTIHHVCVQTQRGAVLVGVQGSPEQDCVVCMQRAGIKGELFSELFARNLLWQQF